MKEIDLENMTGEEFEVVCQEIFSKYYQVPVERTPLVGDGGKDLIIRFDEPIYVECKHHKNTIGRPIVQKLHSAMVTDWVKKGIIVTTGDYSPQAIKHVKDNNLPIQLIDGKELNKMAESVGIKLYFGYDVHIEGLTIIPIAEEVGKSAIRSFLENLDYRPSGISSIYQYIGTRTKYQIFYAVDYQIFQEFYNSKKDILIDTIDVNGKILLDMETLQPLSKKLLNFYMTGKIVPLSEIDHPPNVQPKHIRADVENKAFETLIYMYSKTVSYRSTNGNRYDKKIEPAKRNIHLSGMKLYYLPIADVEYILNSKRYNNQYMFNGNSYIPCDDYSCKCGSKSKPLTVCTNCSDLYCKKHIKECTLCGRSVCTDCGTKYKISLFKSGIACKECRERNPGLKYKK